MSKARKPTLVIAGGGTGGHIYPAVAIAKSFLHSHPEWDVHFVGARGGLEEKIVPREGFPLHLIPVGKLHKSVGRSEQIKTLLTMPLSLLKCLLLVLRLRPRRVLGVGGFASGPFLLIASLLGRRTYIWEPNAYPGLANRILSRFTSGALVVFSEAARHLKSKTNHTVGLPVRSSMKSSPRADQRSPQKPLRVLVFGGSQGARAINQALVAAIRRGGDWLARVQIVHQCGALDFPSLQSESKSFPDNIQVFEFLHDMDERLKWADLVICRAGASTIAEICACQKAAIFIPLPTAADNHQEKNARVLVDGEAAEMILQKDLTPENLIDHIHRFANDPGLQARLEKNVLAFQHPHAAEEIVQHLTE